MRDESPNTLSQNVSISEIESLWAKKSASLLSISPASQFLIGAESSLLHWLAGWGRSAGRRALYLRDAPATDESKSAFITLAELVGTSFTRETQESLKTSLVKQRVRRWLNEQLDLFNRQHLKDGQLIICADFLDAPLPRQLYRFEGAKPEVASQRSFDDLLRNLTSGRNSVVPIFLSPGTHHDGAGIEETIIPTVVYELFRNTNDHSIDLYDGKRNPFSCRGIFFQLHEAPLDDLVKRSDDALQSYLMALKKSLKAGPNTTVALLEMSVFDSGSGLAQHRRKQDFSSANIDIELEAVKECFRLHSTGVPGDYKRGLGLDRVQKSLTQLKAFMRLRTGRLSVFRDFLTFPYQESVVLHDTSASGPLLKQREECSGALFSVFVPCRRVE